MKVIHLPTTVGGNPQGLSRALKKLGVQSISMTLRQNVFDYPVDVVLWNDNDSKLRREIKRFAFLRGVLREFDIVHFNAGSTLFTPPSLWIPKDNLVKNVARAVYSVCMNALQVLEFVLLKWRGVPMFAHYQGDDARQGDVSLRRFEISAATQVGVDYYNRISDAHKRSQIHRISKYCQKIYAVNPDLLYVLPSKAEFIPYCHISLDDWTPKYTQEHTGPLRIGHAPSHRGVKGTPLVLQALEELKADGYAFNLVLVEGLSNTEARACYESIDVLIDQLFVGWYGGLALECMALGKPVLVYIRHDDLKFVPPGMAADLPFIDVRPDTIKEGLRKVLTMPRRELVEIGKRSRLYVERWHDPEKIAARVLADYTESLSERAAS